MPLKKELILGSDHAGFRLKEALKPYLEGLGYSIKDLGGFKYNPKDDYPDYGFRVAKEVARKKSRGILFCGSSHGMCIVANKVKGIRAVSVNTEKDANSTRTDDDANVLCLSGWNITQKKAKKILSIWLKTRFSKAKRHQRRINKIKKIERKTMRS